MRVAFIVNSRIKQRVHFDESLKKAEQVYSDISFIIFLTEYRGHAIELSEKACSEGFDFIISVGGDGTLNEVVNGYFRSVKNSQSGNQTVLGVLPYGTANDFVKTINTQVDLLGMMELINKASYKDIGAGRVTCTDEAGVEQIRYFINIADLGMGAEVVQRVDKSSKRLGASLTFSKAIVQTFLSYRKKLIQFQMRKSGKETKLLTLAIANGKYFGSGMCIAPDANPLNESLATVLIGNVSLWDYLMKIGKIKKGIKIAHPEVSYDSSDEIVVKHLQEKVGIEADGEFLGYTPATIKSLPRSVKFITNW